MHKNIPSRPTVAEVVPLIQALHATYEGGVGCCLHIVVDDPNYEDYHVQYCLDYAKEHNHPKCIEIAEKLLMMTETQRKKCNRLG